MNRFVKISVLAAVAGFSAVSRGALINFDDGAVAVNSTLSDQYASSGVTFVPGLNGATGISVTGLGGSGFASNTDMTIVSATGADVGGGVTAPAGGLLLHSFNGYLAEDNDAVFSIVFASPISSITVTFAGVFDTAASRIFAVDGTGAAFASAATTAIGTSNVTLTPSSPVSMIVITDGDFEDWVGIDNINFTPVPEPMAMGLMALGGLAMGRRRRA